MKGYRRFKFVQPLVLKGGTFKVGDEVSVIGDRIYYNGGQVTPLFHELLSAIVEDELTVGFKYLREVPVPYNKA